MIPALLVNEWRGMVRDGRAMTIFALGALLVIIASWSAASTDHRERRAQIAATESARKAWLEREAENPHGRAHFGDYVFRPSGPLAGLDSGLQMVTGRSVRIEAHRQNDAVHMPHREASTLLRFQRLEPSTLLNLLVPLIVVLAGFATVTSDRETGRLRLLRIQGVHPLPLLLAKSLALWAIGAVLVLIAIASHLAVAGGTAELDHLVAYLALHLVSVGIAAALVTCVSSWCRRPATAAGVLLGLWVCGAIVLPRLAAMTANASLPLPGRETFHTAMREDREKGLDGHNPQDARSKELEQSILSKYGVASKEALPINLDGLLMQADEEYGNKVWDKHFGGLEERLRRQSACAGVFSFVNPFHATSRISMAIAGTDLNSHLAFLRQAETYRRALVKSLNDKQAYGGSKTDDWEWKADNAFYASLAPFRFEPPVLREAIAERSSEISALAVWGLALTGLFFVSSRRLARGGSL